MWTPHSLDLPAVGSLSTGGGGWGIGLGKAATKDANAPSKKVKYNLDTIFDFLFFFLWSCQVDYDAIVNSHVLLFNEDQLQGREAGSQ